MEERDQELRCALGDYRGWLYAVAGAMAGHGSNDLDDLVQEGYIAMWRALGTYDPGKGALPSWLTGAAKLRMADVLRRETWTGVPRVRGHVRERPAFPVEDKYLNAASSVVGDSVMLAYHQGEITRALATLTLGEREAVYRKFWLDEVVPNGYWSRAVAKLAVLLPHLADGFC